MKNVDGSATRMRVNFGMVIDEPIEIKEHSLDASVIHSAEVSQIYCWNLFWRDRLQFLGVSGLDLEGWWRL